MSKVWYGSINNRIDENKMFCKEIKVGTGMTEYSYSDREAYEVVKVVNQNHVFVRKLDHKHVGNGQMDNNWELISNENNPVIELKKRYGYWNWVYKYTQESLKNMIFKPDDIEIKQLQKKGYFNRYSKTNVSFGVAEYYYDYEF